MKGRSSWRSVRMREQELREDLHGRHPMWLHGWCIGFIVLGFMWATSHLQLVMGSDSLAIRYLVTLGAGYLAYLAVLRLWAGWLVRDETVGVGDAVDAVDLAADVARNIPLPRSSGVPGGGGDFGGGGASGDLADVAGGAFEAVGGADEGVVVVVPVVALFLIGCALLFGAGSLLLLYFGWEALLAVAVELAFTYVSARTAVRVAREGWLQAAVRLTWKPLLGALFSAVLLGAAIDFFIPTAESLPHAIRLIRQSP